MLSCLRAHGLWFTHVPNLLRRATSKLPSRPLMDLCANWDHSDSRGRVYNQSHAEWQGHDYMGDRSPLQGGKNSGRQQKGGHLGCSESQDKPCLPPSSQTSLPRFWDLTMASWQLTGKGEFMMSVTGETGWKSSRFRVLGLPVLLTWYPRETFCPDYSKTLNKHRFWFFPESCQFANCMGPCWKRCPQAPRLWNCMSDGSPLLHRAGRRAVCNR